MHIIQPFRLNRGKPAIIHIEEDAEFLHVGSEGGELFVWARFDKDAPRREREFRLYTDGQPVIPNPRELYLGSARIRGSLFGSIHESSTMWHVFRVIDSAR